MAIDASIAVDKKDAVSACSSCSPVSTISKPSGWPYCVMASVTCATTSLGANPGSTFDDKVITRFWLIRLIPPNVLLYDTLATADNGI